ncbi:ankyrin repeat domain-containing protein, partial [Candidatus Cardinium sp. cBcalN1]|uniref:ankyrin repeat domain-containing protein n=1 Tax=Candidatus Cardinium sp. cBcalN1 TaxID=2699437 RepID=UPI001FB2FED4
SVFEDVEKYIKKHRTPCDQDINDFINSVRKAIEEKYKQDHAVNYEEQLNAFIKNIDKANKSSAGDTGPISQVSSSKEKDCSSITTGAVQRSMVLSEEFLDKMHRALYKSKAEAIEVWRNARLHKDARDSHGFTLLMHLTQKGSELSSNDSGKTFPEYTREFWDWFVERADLDEKNAKNNDGDTALMLAAKRFHTAFIRRLINHGADPFIKNNKGEYFMTLLIKSTYRLYHISDLKSAIASVFEDV